MVNKKEVIQKSGTILEALPNTHFKVMIDDGAEIIAHLAGKLRLHRIRVLPGDKVTVEMSSPDDIRGRIIYRKK